MSGASRPGDPNAAEFSAGNRGDARARADADSEIDTEVIALAEETLTVSKRLVERERVLVRLVTDEVAELARVNLRTERIEIERVPIGREVERAPEVREEGGVTIIPVLEEIVVVEKRLVLKEELHVRRVADTREEEQPVTLRRQRAEIERLVPPIEDGQPGATPPNPGQQGKQA